MLDKINMVRKLPSDNDITGSNLSGGDCFSADTKLEIIHNVGSGGDVGCSVPF